MSETEAQATKMLLAGHRARVGWIASFAAALLITIIGFIALAGALIILGIVLLIIAGVFFARSNRRIELAELELAKIHDAQPPMV